MPQGHKSRMGAQALREESQGDTSDLFLRLATLRGMKSGVTSWHPFLPDSLKSLVPEKAGAEELGTKKSSPRERPSKQTATVLELCPHQLRKISSALNRLGIEYTSTSNIQEAEAGGL